MTHATNDMIQTWVDHHRDLGHDAHFTTAGAPGYGNGSYCFTCRIYGPNNINIYDPEDVR